MQKKSVTKLIDSDGTVTNKPIEIAEKFNEYFSSIAKKLKQENLANTEQVYHDTFLNNSTINSIYLRPVEPDEINEIIKGFKNKSTSDTKISALKIANEDAKFRLIISDIVNLSFEQGIFPEQLKLAKVIPLYKGGSKTDITNYRPISLLSSFSKIFEKTMHGRIVDFMEQNNSFYEMQYGFRKGRSCEYALLTAQNTLLDSLNRNEISLLLLIDFSKAFDMVDHRILLKKLYHYGIRGNTFDWLKSYLHNRKQYVGINGISSTQKSLEFGVPQGSILGPLLFVIYINDIPKINQLAKFILYADDANIIITGTCLQEIEQQFHVLSKLLVDWVNSNGLALNIGKTKYMIFSRHKVDTSLFNPKILNRPLERQTTARFLGVLIDDKLNWSQHISVLKTKMSRYIGIMYKLKGYLPLSARLNIFHSLVQSHINFCSLIWGFAAKTNINSIFTMQKKAIRAVMPGFVNYFYKDGVLPNQTKSAFVEFNILTVHNIIVKNAIILMHKIHHFPNNIPISVSEIISHDAPIPGSTHESCSNWLSKYSTNVYAKSVVYKGPLLYTDILNELETKGLYSNIISCKHAIKKYLFEQQGSGDGEWQAGNFKLFNISGLRKSNRIKNQ